MFRVEIPILNVLVAGDASTGKANFIKRFLYHYPSSAEVHRKNVTIHFVYKPENDFKIQLHDVSNIKTIEHSFYDNMDVVFFCYAANDQGSFQNLEKWIQLMKVAKKEIHSFLVADMSNVDSHLDVAELLAAQAKKLTESSCIKRFISSSFDDQRAACTAFRTILNDLYPPKLNKERPTKNLYIKSPRKVLKTCFTEMLPCVSETYPDNIQSF